MQQNIIERLLDAYSNWIDSWSLSHFGFFPEAVLLIGIPTLLCIVAFERGSRSVFIQVLAFVFGILLAAAIPVERLIPERPTAKMWLFTLCLVLLLFLPAFLARLLTPELGRQRKIQVIFYVILSCLFVLNLVVKGD